MEVSALLPERHADSRGDADHSEVHIESIRLAVRNHAKEAGIHLNHVGAGALTRPDAPTCAFLFRGSGNPGVAQR